MFFYVLFASAKLRNHSDHLVHFQGLPKMGIHPGVIALLGILLEGRLPSWQ